MTGPVTLTPAGASLAAAGLVLSTVTVPVRVNSRPSRAGGTTSLVSLGSETYARGLPPQVFHGTVNEAVVPETVKGWATEPFTFAEKYGVEATPAGSATLRASVAEKHGPLSVSSPCERSTKRTARWLTASGTGEMAPVDEPTTIAA